MKTALDFYAVFEASPNPYMLLDQELQYVAANRAYLEVTGSSRERILGKSIFDVFPHDPTDPDNAHARLLRASFEKVLETRASDVLALIPYRVARKPGGPLEERFWSATHTPIFDDRGDVAFILQHTVDVTELERLRSVTEASGARSFQLQAGVLGRARLVQAANVTLDEELRHQRRLFEQAPGFICFLRGPTHVFELVNAAYSTLVGNRALLGLPVKVALPELTHQKFLEVLDRVFASGNPFVGRSMRVELRQSLAGPLSERFLDFVYQPIADHDGRTLGIFVQGNDVTDLRAARAEAERANRLKDNFLATVSHELRTPLTAMIGWLQLLRTGELPPERRERALDTIERNARAQSQLVDDILDVSRIMSGKLQLEVSPTVLSGVIDASIEAVRPASDSKEITLHTAVDPQAQVMGDPGRLQQIVWNLLSNAVKFTPRGGRVDVRVERIESSVEIAISDTGQGIEADFLAHVFERFRQAEESTTRKHGGLGLGLAIVKQLVELHGGTVSASSDGPGRGASFQVRFPISVVRRREGDVMGAAASRRAFVCPPEIQGLRVLVVEDERDTRELLREVLHRCGSDVQVATSAAEGFELFARSPFDLLVSDIGLPLEDGYGLIRRVRELPPERGGRVPAVALTALARTEDRTRALLSGFKAHLPKPIDLDELLAVLASLAPARN